MRYLIKILSLVVLLSFPFTATADSNVLCDTINHTPKDDVNYKPSPNVVPADLNAVPIEIGDVEIPLTAFLAQDLGLDTPVSSSKLGVVTIKEDGAVIYDGKDISSNVIKLCGQPKEIPSKPKKQDGQVKVEAVKSQKLNEPETPKPSQKKIPDEENIYGGFGQDYINGTYND